MNRLYTRLLQAYGPQGWWPAESSFEVMVGAILTQNTTWVQVIRAIDRLRDEALLAPTALLDLSVDALAERIRPAGYPNVKARRLQALCQWLVRSGGLSALAECATDTLRADLLAVHGVGPETADSILLYALARPVFVIDAYTRRILSRCGYIEGREPYETLRRKVESGLRTADPVADYNELHALIVQHGKIACRPRPRCEACILRTDCAAARKDRRHG